MIIMPLTNKQSSSIKNQLLKQIENFPEDKQEQLKEYISSMNNLELEQFLIKNQMMSKESKQENSSSKSKNQCVMCMISAKEIESFAIYEDKDYLAALEINPYSEGHTILIPKKHIKETKNLKAKAFTLADKIGKHLVKQLKAENFQITTSDELNHAIINIIPVYKGKKLTYERKSAKKQELQELAIKIGALKKRVATKKIESKNKIDIKAFSNILKLPRRIP